MNPTLGFDYVIVGGGTAGCALAGRLGGDPSARVCLIEAGPRDDALALKLPGLSFLAGRNPRFEQHDQTEPEPALNGRRLTWVHARVLGGGSSINGMVHTRAHSSEYDAWGCDGWRFAELLPLFIRSEASERGAGPWHGDRGPVGVSRGRAFLPIADIFLEAAADAGQAVVDDLNADPPAGFGHYDHAVRGGRRCSTAAAYLSEERPNIAILTGATAVKLHITGGRATGVEILTNGRVETVWAASEIILCAGAVGSPRLMLLSGIGDPGALREAGVAPVVSNPEVGRNLRNHVRFSVEYACEAPVTARRHATPAAMLDAALRYGAARSGFLSRPNISTGGSMRSEPGLKVADLKVTFFNGLPGTGAGRLGVAPREHGFSAAISQCSPQSHGEVRLRSASPLERAAIRPRNFSAQSDLAVLAGGVAALRDMLDGPAMRRIGAREVFRRGGGEGAIADEIRARATNVFHDTGTCRMGMDPASVVDARLRVRGVDGLRVADASIAPTLLSANTNATVIVIAEKAADLIAPPIASPPPAAQP